METNNQSEEIQVNGDAFLRDLVAFMDNRNEHLNQNKTVKQLINDFFAEQCPDPNYGNTYCIGY